MSKNTYFNFYSIISDHFLTVLNLNKESNYKNNWFYDQQDIIPVNPYTNRFYTGFNQFILSAYCKDKNYRFNRWLTISQIHELGAMVKRDQIPVSTVFPIVEYFSNGENVTEEVNIILEDGGRVPVNVTESVTALRENVFNIDQCDSLPQTYFKEKQSISFNDESRFEVIAELAKNIHANIRFTEMDCPQFYPLQDIIVSPKFNSQTPNVYAQLASKIAAWSGGRTRLKRNQNGSSFNQSFFQESLTCELMAAILCANLGFSYPINLNPMILLEWEKCMANDTKFVFNAVHNAVLGADFLIEANKYGMSVPKAKELF